MTPFLPATNFKSGYIITPEGRLLIFSDSFLVLLSLETTDSRKYVTPSCAFVCERIIYIMNGH